MRLTQGLRAVKRLAPAPRPHDSRGSSAAPALAAMKPAAGPHGAPGMPRLERSRAGTARAPPKILCDFDCLFSSTGK